MSGLYLLDPLGAGAEDGTVPMNPSTPEDVMMLR
jgi:hypothetical protein